jgi:phosphatidylserine/phosphatidylglycerophosphate/cardiolipin synthase-like enzyme
MARLGDFIDGARQTLDISIYDLRLNAGLDARLRQALAAALARGVRVRAVYNDVPDQLVGMIPPALHPPPSPGVRDEVQRLGIDAVAIRGVPDLMHHKYMVRDAGDAGARVWTGSTNWTTDSWTREENLIVEIPSPGLAADYTRNFEELWGKRQVQASGHFDPDWRQTSFTGRDVACRCIFSPGRGRRMAHLFADRLGQARHRIRICSPVLTSGPVLGSLAEIPESMDCRVVFDATQMDQVLRQWRADPRAAWKAPAFTEAIARLAHASKRSTPYAPGSVHDYMHAKLVVADDVVLLGSYNLSHSGEMNAENVVELRDAELAEQLAAFVDAVFERYAEVTR